MSVDLNLMRTFLAILDTGSVTAASQELNLTQPTVSHALARLRKQVGDPLFIRRGTGLTPTARAVDLAPAVRTALRSLDDALARDGGFDASVSEHVFRLCLSDVGESSFLPAILKALRQQAPHASVVVVPTDINRVTDWLRLGEVEAAVASIALPVAGVHTILSGDRYVALMSPELAPPGPRLSVDELAGARRIAVDNRVGHEQLDVALDAMGVRGTPILRVQHFSVLPQLVSGGSAMAILPAQMAQNVAPPWGLVTRELPEGVPQYDVNLYWDPEVTGAAGPKAWFVELVRHALTGIAPAVPATGGS